MSTVLFISFCIENYADLHGMGVEYMIDFCRKYLDGGKV